jgi:excisionase family DNA binding protein
MSSRLLTAEEVASQLGIELDTLYRYARSGQIRGLKLGKLWRFAESDVATFIEARRFVTRRAQPSHCKLLTDILAAGVAVRRGGVVCGAIRTSYADIDAMSSRLAGALGRGGVRAGDRILVILPTCTEFVTACFAVWKLGAVLVPEFTGIRPTNLAHVLSDAAPTAMIIDNAVAERLQEPAVGLGSVRTILVKDSTFTLSGIEGVSVHSLNDVLESAPLNGWRPPHAARPDDVVSLTYTSGSTGLPKGVMHTHASTLAGADFTRQYHAVTSADSIVIPLPLHHGLAFRQLFAYATADATIILAADIYQALKLLKDYHPTAMVLVPAAANLIIDHFPGVLEEAGARLRYVEVGSAAFGAERVGRLRALLPHTKVCLPYGLTEARVGFLECGSDGRFNRIATVAPGLALSVVDGGGKTVSVGETGNITLRGDGLMKGYWTSTPAEIATLAREGFATGDMGLVTEQGVELLGRMDDMLKVGGRKVNPTEVELALARHADVADAAVAAAPDSSGVFEAVLHAYVVPKKGATLSEEELLAFCRRQIEPYKLPSRIHFRTSLPKSAVGKILRSELAKERAAVST